MLNIGLESLEEFGVDNKEELVISLSATTPKGKETSKKDILVEDEQGHLKLVSELEDKDFTLDDLEEERAAGLESLSFGKTKDAPTPTNQPIEQKPNTFSADVQKKLFNIAGNCSLELDILIHMLHHASEEDEFTILLGCVSVNPFLLTELATVIESSVATVTVICCGCDGLDSLFVAASADKLVCEFGMIISPMSSFHYGNSNNVQTTLEAHSKYEKQFLDSLKSRKLLTEEEVVNIQDGHVIYLPKERFDKE